MKKRMRQTLSLLLSLMMVLIILPTSAFAAEPGSDSVYFPSKIVDNQTTYTYTYDNGVMTCQSSSAEDYDYNTFESLFVLPKDTNIRNIVLSEAANFDNSYRIDIMLSDAVAAGKINGYVDELGDGANYTLSDGKISSLKYTTATNNSTFEYSKGNLTKINLSFYSEVYLGEDTATYKISYKNGAVSSVRYQASESEGTYNYTNDKQGRVTQIKYKYFGGDEEIGTLKFTYDKNGNLTGISNKWHYSGTPKTSYTTTVHLSYTDNLVTKVTVKSNEPYSRNHTITAEYQTL